MVVSSEVSARSVDSYFQVALSQAISLAPWHAVRVGQVIYQLAGYFQVALSQVISCAPCGHWVEFTRGLACKLLPGGAVPGHLFGSLA